MKKLALLLLSGIMLSGCVTHQPTLIQQKADPTWPDPIQQYQVNSFKVINQNGKLWVGMSFDDSQNFRIWLNDIKRYVKDQDSMICYYRSQLKENRCLPYLPKGTTDVKQVSTK